MLLIAPCSSSLDTACTARFSRRVGPGRAHHQPGRSASWRAQRQQHELGEAAGALLDAADHARVPTQCAGVSTCPYIIVDEVGCPARAPS